MNPVIFCQWGPHTELYIYLLKDICLWWFHWCLNYWRYWHFYPNKLLVWKKEGGTVSPNKVQTQTLLTDCTGSNLDLRFGTFRFSLSWVEFIFKQSKQPPHTSGKVYLSIILQTCYWVFSLADLYLLTLAEQDKLIVHKQAGAELCQAPACFLLRFQAIWLLVKVRGCCWI